MASSALLERILTHNHNHQFSNTTAFDNILTSLMAPLCGSDICVRDMCGDEFDALIPYLLSSSASSSSSSSSPSASSSLKPRHPFAPGPEGNASIPVWYESRVGGSAEGAGEYDPSYPHLSTPVAGYSSRRRGEGVVSAEVEGYDPFNPSVTFPISIPPPSPSPSPLHSTYAPTPLPPSSSSSSSSSPLPPPTPSSSLPLPPSSLRSLQKGEIAGKRKHRAGDRKRLDAMKRRRIEERRVVEGRDPVTGGRVVGCEEGGMGMGKGMGKGVVGKGGEVGGKKVGGKKVGGGRVGRGRR